MDHANSTNELIPNSENGNIQKKKTKKRCHGNRRLQRYRRKLRQQGMDAEKIAEFMKLSININPSTTNAIQQPGETEETSGATLSKNNSNASNMIKKKKKKNQKKKKSIIKKKNTNLNNSVPGRKVKVSPIVNDSYDYSTVSDEIFSEMISKALDVTENYLDFMDQNAKIKFSRRYTSLLDRLSYLKLQEFQWKYYHEIGTTQNIWRGRIAKHTAEKYSIHYAYGRSKTIIEHRLRQIQEHLVKAENTFQQFGEEILPNFEHENDCYTIMNKLTSIILPFVQEKQKLLKDEMEYRRELLLFDATDHQLLQKFFQAEPNKTHHIIARRIWDATKQQMVIKEDITLLEHRLTSTQAQSTSTSAHRMINNIDKLLNNPNEIVPISTTTNLLEQSLTCSSIFSSLRFYISLRTTSSTDAIYRLQHMKKEIIEQTLILHRDMVPRLYGIIQEEQHKFSVKNRYMESTSEWQKMVSEIIEQRRLHMIERANYITSYRVILLFATDTNIGNNEEV